jgi:hypothetical protein
MAHILSKKEGLAPNVVNKYVERNGALNEERRVEARSLFAGFVDLLALDLQGSRWCCTSLGNSVLRGFLQAQATASKRGGRTHRLPAARNLDPPELTDMRH